MNPAGIINQSYLAAAEPSWAKRVSEWQLLGILNLSALLTPKVYLSDVHLGDNLHIFNSYSSKAPLSLYQQIVALTKAGVINVLLRDKTIRPQQDNAEFEISSFEDVYRSWRAMDPARAFINQDASDTRGDFFKSLDDNLPRAATIRYSYSGVKRRFIDDVRTSANRVGPSWFKLTLETLYPEQRKEYERILAREWFSLSDIYNFFQSNGQEHLGLSAMFAHGLLNESVYSHSVDCDLTGFDTETAFVEERIWRPNPVSNVPLKGLGHQALAERADAVFDAPSLSLLALLTAEQIVEIREMGRAYFDFATHRQRMSQVNSATANYSREFIYHASTYWQTICEYIGQRHQGAAKQPRKLILFFGELPAPFSRISEEAFRFTLGLASEGALGGDASGIKKAIAKVAQFVFLSDTEEMRRLRDVLPFGVWTREAPSGAEPG